MDEKFKQISLKDVEVKQIKKINRLSVETKYRANFKKIEGLFKGKTCMEMMKELDTFNIVLEKDDKIEKDALAYVNNLILSNEKYNLVSDYLRKLDSASNTYSDQLGKRKNDENNRETYLSK